MSSPAVALSGVHFPNVPLSQFSASVAAPGKYPQAAFWGRVARTGVGWAKLLDNEHTPADAAMAKALGMMVIVRMSGEAEVNWERVNKVLDDYAGVVDVIELGNEPPDDKLWDHAVYIDLILKNSLAKAKAAHVTLCTPGWQASKEPPAGAAPLAHIREMYQQFEAIAVHTYDAHDLNQPAIFDRIWRWSDAFNKPVFVTEYGIANRLLPGFTDPAASNLLKAQRYAAFTKALLGVPRVLGSCAFLLGGTSMFAAFDDAADGYKPGGHNSYWLDDAAWTAFGQALRS